MASANYSDITGRVIGHWSGGGGGGSQPVQADYSGSPVTVADGAVGFLTWDNLAGGTDLLDRTDPAAPLFLAAGCYAVTAQVFSDAPLTADGFIWAFVICDIGAIATGTSDHPEVANPMSLCGVVIPGDISQPLQVGVQNLDGAASRDFTLGSVILVKLA